MLTRQAHWIERYGFRIDQHDLANWHPSEFVTLHRALLDLRAAAGWTITRFRLAMDTRTSSRTIRRKAAGTAACARAFACVWPGGDIELYDRMFAPTADPRRVFLHEIGHIWDQRHGGALTLHLAALVDGEERSTAGMPAEADYIGTPSEDFATAVASTVYGLEHDQSRSARWEAARRRAFVLERFGLERQRRS